MKRALLLGFGVALVAAAPAQAANEVVNGMADLTWDKPNVAVAVGDTVTWQFPDTSQFHNVQSDGPDVADADWNPFASPIAQPAQPASFTFKAEGTYAFICVVHPSTMRGTVTVGGAGGPATPPPPSAQPLANDVTAPPVTLEKVDEDKAKPKLSKVSAKRVARGALRVRFRVNEESTVLVSLKRGGKTVKKVELEGSGTGSVTIKQAKAGRYSVQVRATDVAGNVSSLKKTSVTVR